ncbi:MAG: response regulator transcription factor [Planctomycetota bacterium]
MTRSRVLVVEDDAAIRAGILDALQFEGYHTLEAKDGNEGLDSALHLTYDLLLLDLVLPGHDGFEILSEVRRRRPTLPVVILTARGEEGDRVRGLKMGADDYVVKPFSVKELLARVEAVLRRTPERPMEISEVAVPGGIVDLARREVRFDDGERTDLTDRELAVLRYLAANANRAISREELLSRIWGIEPAHSHAVDTRTIDMHIVRLREKLRDNKSKPRVLLTVRGKGYKFATGKDAP